MIITGPAIYSEHGVRKQVGMVVKDGKIAAMDATSAFSDAETMRYPESYHLLPGFIDMHTHGVQGFDVMDATPEALLGISQALACEGTTAFLATTMTAAIPQIEAALKAVCDFMQAPPKQSGAAIIGVHLEGPFLAAAKTGAQSSEHILAFDTELIKEWQALSQHAIKLVTLAPEQKNSADFITYLKSQNIIASMGHTNATYAEAVAAIAMGCTHATHLFNAMSGIHHREPGAVTAALLSDDVMVELILDGLHLHPAVVELVLKLKKSERIVLITDAMRAKCLQDGCYDLGGQTVHVVDGAAKLANGTLAGSTLSMSVAIKNMLKINGSNLWDIIAMTATNPAKALGLYQSKGSIDINKDADFVVLDELYQVVLTVCGGRVVFDKHAAV